MKKLLKFLLWAFGAAWVLQIIAGVPTLFLNPAYAGKLLLRPLMIEVISGLPLMLTAFILSLREKNPIVKER